MPGPVQAERISVRTFEVAVDGGSSFFWEHPGRLKWRDFELKHVATGSSNRQILFTKEYLVSPRDYEHFYD